MRTFLVCLGIYFPFFLWAQDGQTINGKVIDNKSGEPVSYANVALYEAGAEQPLTGTYTDDAGSFTLQDVSPGTYDLVIHFVGYEDNRLESLQVTRQTGSLNLDALKLSKASQELEEVVVEGQEIRRPVETTLEGLTIDPEQNLSNVGGSVLDILRNSPSVSVGQDGGITIRGSSSTNVLINGRNSALADGLEQIPASAIENIQVVNNPNAKYDAEGTGGVVNIKLKKGEESTMGTHGRAEVTLGNRYRINTSVNLNHQGERFNVFGGYNYRRSPSIGNAESERITLNNNPRRIVQNRDIERNDDSHTINYGLDYFFPGSQLSYEGVFETEDENDTEITYSNIYDLDDNLLMGNVRNNRETEENYTFDNSLIYTRNFAQKGREFRALVSHSYRDNLETQNTITRSGETSDEEDPLRQRAATDEKQHVAIAQADYIHPWENGKFEAGYKSTLRRLDTDYIVENFGSETEEWMVNTDVTNRFLYQEQVHALYAIYERSFEKIDVSLGTRLEGTVVDTRLYNTGEENDQRYLSPFPSVSGLYHLTEDQSLKLTYSRRINRPRSRHLNPFADIADSLNIRLGNPNLQPEFIQSLEFGHKVTFEKADLTTTAFYRHTNNKVDWILRVDDNGVSYRMPDNLVSGTNYGVEFINTATLASWWDVNGSISLFRSIIDGSNLNQGYVNASFAWNAKLISNFALPWDLDFQMTGNYESPEVEAQGFDYARYYLDMSFQRGLFNGNGSISLSLRDVFNTYYFGGENSTDDFRSYFLYKRDTRRGYVSLEYKF